MFFPGSGSEMKILTEEFSPPASFMNKKEFEALIAHATKQRYSFLHINMREPVPTRYRHNLDTILKIDE